MLPIPPDQQDAFKAAVESAKLRVDVRNVVENVYLAVQDAIDLQKPVCDASGRCCKFDEYGHRLFITTLELGAFLANDYSRQSQFIGTVNPGGCIFQVRGLCGVHDIRPFGCRIFFCDPSATEWQRTQYERFHSELKRLHAELDVPYFYVEWREALRILGVSPS